MEKWNEEKNSAKWSVIIPFVKVKVKFKFKVKVKVKLFSLTKEVERNEEGWKNGMRKIIRPNGPS